MFKFKWVLMVFSCGLMVTQVFGQEFTFQPATQPDTKKSASPSLPKVKVISPDEFKSQVNTKNKKTQDALSKQIDNLLPKKPPTNPSSPPPPLKVQETPKESGKANPVPTPAQPEPEAPMPAASSADQVLPQAAPVMEQPPAEQQQTTAAPSSSSGSRGAQKPYTGFGSGDSGADNKSPPSEGGGWNVKY